MSKKKWQIPFDENGNMMNYAEHWRNPVWKDNFEWEDELRYKTYLRGRSAAHMLLASDKTGKEYIMFLTDFEDVIPLLVKGVVKGTFTFTKRGQNYGVRLV